jgi:hypothetical protein
MSHSGHDMDDMGGDSSTGSDSGSSSSGHSSGGHASAFQNTIMTTLFSNDWTTTNTGAYAGTCIFLIVLAVVARLLVALKARMEVRWESQAVKRRFVAVNGKGPLAERISGDRESKQLVLSENGVEEHVFVVENRTQTTRPWRFSVDPVRALLDTVIVGIGYLLLVPPPPCLCCPAATGTYC